VNRWRIGDDDREIFRLAVPALGALIAEPLYVLADTAIIGHLGTEELSGFAIASGILLTAYSLFIFLAYGTTASVARLVGAGQEREAAHQAIQGIWLATIAGVVWRVACGHSREPLIALFTDDRRCVRTRSCICASRYRGFRHCSSRWRGSGISEASKTRDAVVGRARHRSLFNLVLETILIFGLGLGVGASRSLRHSPSGSPPRAISLDRARRCAASMSR
jgi:hypothetical protein